MTTTIQIFWGSILLGLCSLMQIFLLLAAVKLTRLAAHHLKDIDGILRMSILASGAFAAVVFGHTVQVWLWAGSFVYLGALPGIASAIYFSLVTYTTVGYGDVTVGPAFRVCAAMASVTGLLNFGLSTAFLVGVFGRMLGELEH